MSSPPTVGSPADRLRQLEGRAKIVRSRLLRAVEALDARRHQVVEIKDAAKRLAAPAAASLLGVAALVGVGAIGLGLLLKSRRRRTLGGRAVEAIRALDLVRTPSLTRRIFDRLTLTVVTVAASELARRGLHNLLDGRLLDGRLAVGNALDDHHRQLTAPAPIAVLPAKSPVKGEPATG